MPRARSIAAVLGLASLTASGLSACGGDDDVPAVQPPSPTEVEGVAALELEPVDQLVRASLSLRGIRPSTAELDAVAADPAVLQGLVDGWVQEDAFAEVVKDLHAEQFLLRNDTTFQLPVTGVLGIRGYNQAHVYTSTTEAPLELVAEVVTADRPYGEILTVDYTLADAVVADVYGLPYDPVAGGWQRTHWVDGRPQSGLLSDSQMWRRHVSNAANFHRGRANFVSKTFLCEDIGGRDVFVGGGVDISDELEVAHAVSNDPGCVACHSVLDPLAAFWWGYKEQLQRGAILEAYDQDCEWDWSQGDPPRGAYRVEHWCYPLKFYDVEEAEGWETWGLKGPGFFGQPAGDVRDLGWMIREDPRFATCTARTVFGYLAQVPLDEVPESVVTDLRDVFVDSDQSFRELAKAAVMHPAFRTVDPGDEAVPSVGLLSLRPEAWTRTVEDLTGFQWLANEDQADCGADPNTCWGPVDLASSDLFGFRSMFGGIDATTVTHPIHTPTATKLMALQRMSEEAAGFVVMTDFGQPASGRKLLTLVEPSTTDEAAVREQLVALHRRVLTLDVAADGPEVDATYALWASARQRADAAEGWRVVISALLQDPRMVLY